MLLTYAEAVEDFRVRASMTSSNDQFAFARLGMGAF